MQIIQSRRDFLASRGWPAPQVLGARGSLADEGPPETTTVRLRPIPGICIAPAVHRRGSAARGGLHRYPVCAVEPVAHRRRRSRAARSTSTRTSRQRWSLSIWMPAMPITALRACIPGASSCSRTSPSAAIGDLKGKSVGIAEASARARTCTSRSWRRRSGSTRTRTSTGSPVRRQPHGAVRRGQGRCFPRLPARAAGAARPQDRPHDPQHGHGPAMVAVFLLHAVRQQRTSSAIIRSPPSASCAPSSRRPTCAPPSRSGPRNVWSMAGSRRATTTRSRR